MKTAEECLKNKFGGYVGKTKVYITEKQELIDVMEEYGNQFKIK